MVSFRVEVQLKGERKSALSGIRVVKFRSHATFGVGSICFVVFMFVFRLIVIC